MLYKTDEISEHEMIIITSTKSECSSGQDVFCPTPRVPASVGLSNGFGTSQITFLTTTNTEHQLVLPQKDDSVDGSTFFLFGEVEFDSLLYVYYYADCTNILCPYFLVMSRSRVQFKWILCNVDFKFHSCFCDSMIGFCKYLLASQIDLPMVKNQILLQNMMKSIAL